MRKPILFFWVTQLSFAVVGTTQVHQGQIDSALMPVLGPHYQSEYTFDKCTNPAGWNLQKGLHAGFGSTDALYFRTEAPAINEKLSWSGTGWKGERLNAQIIVWSSDSLEQVRFKVSN